FGDVVSNSLAHGIFESGLNNVFLAQLSADFIVDIADKAISTLIVVCVVRILPARFREAYNFQNWHKTKAGQVRGVSLRVKIMALIATVVLSISVAVTVITVHQFNEAAMEEQYLVGESIDKVIASLVDGNHVEEYITQGEQAEGYVSTKSELTAIMNSEPDIAFIYVYRIQEDGCHVVFDLDTEEVPGEPAGTIIGFDEAFTSYLPDLLAGREIEPVVSDETYGWLLTFYYPVYDDAGICQCYAAVDISMPQLMVKQQIFMTRTICLFLNFFVLLLCVGVYLAEIHIVDPVNRIANAMQHFDYESETDREESMVRLRDMDIHTGDEIENLYNAFVASSEAILRFIDQNNEKSEKISKLQNGLIMILADVVESRDKCTGDHVRKTAAYASIIMDQLRADGVYADQLTDEFVADVINSAPLHDVGKIHISDLVLNSPARLTDDEYAIMKQHTTIRAAIIQNAIETLADKDDVGYLKEAQNLAKDHHERWDGKGYPTGISGEDIPLSARIMAVADVFDALYSKRSYKEGFSFEKSMGIIREGAGTQFDPRIVESFLHAEEKVHQVADAHRNAENLNSRQKD
ncbi:MAG: HD domain-containing protein, partial [Clostridia bacterium]|nr:HD domain-containing protein [Clostridia bacterium]